MGGIKHHLWGQVPDGYQPDATGNYKDNELDYQRKMLAEQKPYCGVCGEQILMSSEDKHGQGVNWEMELRMGMHYRCYTEEMMKKRQEMQRGPQS